MIVRLFDTLSHETHNDDERHLLSKTLLSRQQEKNEKIINEQGRLIDTLNAQLASRQRFENEPNKFGIYFNFYCLFKSNFS